MSAYTKLEDWYRPSPPRDIFEVTVPVLWEIGKLGSGLLVTVPAGFHFDVSTPRCLQWFVEPSDPKFMKAAALHDYTLTSGWDRVSAAALFSEALRADEVGRFKRLVCVIAVIIWNWK